jgi:uncharacterized membrane protein YphA (DoxX/SURF4 family)
MKNYHATSSLILRLGMAAVVAWFGTAQITNPAAWVSLVPNWAMSISPLSRAWIIYLNGGFEIIAALFLALGIFSRWAALLLSLHLLVIASAFGSSPTGVRDFGLAVALFVIFLSGKDSYCLDYKDTSKETLVIEIK